jgi:polysaccharide pyruvyl transferase WcaK-like protein
MMMERKPKILIADAYSAAHVGNGVLFQSSVQLLREHCPDAEIEALAQKTGTLPQITDVPCHPFLFQGIPVGQGGPAKLLWLARNGLFLAIQIINQFTLRLPPHRLAPAGYRRTALQKIEEADVLISISGEAINDSFRKTLPFFLFVYWLGNMLGKRVILFPQSIGPLRRSWTRRLTQFVLRRLTLVVGRDRASIEELEGLGIPEGKVRLCPDVGTLQPYLGQTAALEILHKLGITLKEDSIRLGVTVSSWVEEGVPENRFLDDLAQAIATLAASRCLQVVILPANMPLEGCSDSDYQACLAFREKLQDSVVAVDILPPRVIPPEHFKGVLSLLDLFVSTRMHVSILSTMALTPTVTLNTQRKLKGYMSNIGQERFSLDIEGLSSTVLASLLAAALEDREKIQDELRQAREKMADAIRAFASQTLRPMLDCPKEEG